MEGSSSRGVQNAGNEYPYIHHWPQQGLRRRSDPNLTLAVTLTLVLTLSPKPVMAAIRDLFCMQSEVKALCWMQICVCHKRGIQDQCMFWE